MLGHKRSDGQLERATSSLVRVAALSTGGDGIGMGVAGVRASSMANASSGSNVAAGNNGPRRRRPRAATARTQRPPEEVAGNDSRGAPKFQGSSSGHWRDTVGNGGNVSQGCNNSNSTAGVGLTAESSSSNAIIIHVIDEVKRVRKDFPCSQAVLLQHMKYFESYLVGTTSDDEVDISVHCDVDVFQWLAEYMMDSSKIASLTADTVVSILISAEFLQISRLVEECVSFMHKSLNQVVRVPVDLSCLSDELVRQLAARFTDDELEAVRDRHDRLLSRLYSHKLKELLCSSGNTLQQCLRCRSLFTAEQHEGTICPKAAVTFDFHGTVIAQHVPNEGWDVSQHLQHCHEQLQMSWRETYWRMWSHLQFFRCGVCRRSFSGAEFEHCSYHSEQPVWRVPPQAHLGTYPCCNQPALRFGEALPQRVGCSAREHKPDLRGESEGLAATFQKLLRHRTLACIPFDKREVDSSPQLSSDRACSPAVEGCDDCDGDGEVDASPLRGDEDHEGEEDDIGFAVVSEGSSLVATSNLGWSKVAWARTSACYCFAPPPEHCPLGRQKRGRRPRPLLRPVGHQGVNSGRRRQVCGQSRGSAHSNRNAVQTGGPCTTKTIEQGTVQKDLEDTLPDKAMHRCWPGPPPDGTPTFFALELPSCMSDEKKSEFKMDMLREDDKRRMDMLRAHLHRKRHLPRAAAAGHSVGHPAASLSAAAQRRSLAWVGRTAAGPNPS